MYKFIRYFSYGCPLH